MGQQVQTATKEVHQFQVQESQLLRRGSEIHVRCKHVVNRKVKSVVYRMIQISSRATVRTRAATSSSLNHIGKKKRKAWRAVEAEGIYYVWRISAICSIRHWIFFTISRMNR